MAQPLERVAAGMMAFMRAFGLVFGAFDFAVTDAPLTATLADLLAEEVS